ncbi:hypothetical protein ZEAMMB73_Zm00001d050892 [Zea mays]|uniref:Uncharacterized protein n=1 Tax=Zea mays TaxID=4577 RepID=A0A1D6Q3R7_MAIZE|nr:hypothetical protein ZEAMMB73_Zm00001d050892 [Zea mays]AQK53206.1 hypothetical protein ZEAMMB73_Zm00001d050892 [Zea mays]
MALSAKGKEVCHRSCDVLDINADEWGNENRSMTTELREQQYRLRKALEDRVQVSRETAKMWRWDKLHQIWIGGPYKTQQAQFKIQEEVLKL